METKNQEIVLQNIKKQISILPKKCENPFKDNFTPRRIVLHNSAEFELAMRKEIPIYKEQITLHDGSERIIYYIMATFEDILSVAIK